MNIFDFIDTIRFYDYSTILFWWKIVAAFISIALVAVIGYAAYRTQEVFAIIRGTQKETIPPSTNILPVQTNVDLWEKVRARVSSDDENERKLALIAADSLVDKILERSGYRGANLGERLKNIEPSDLDSLNDVWEAHKVRNRIAHEAHLPLPKEAAVLALSRYEKVLKELRYL